MLASVFNPNPVALILSEICPKEDEKKLYQNSPENPVFWVLGPGLPDPGFSGLFWCIFSVLSDQEKRRLKKCIFWNLEPKMGPTFTRNMPHNTLSGPLIGNNSQTVRDLYMTFLCKIFILGRSCPHFAPKSTDFLENYKIWKLAPLNQNLATLQKSDV